MKHLPGVVLATAGSLTLVSGCGSAADSGSTSGDSASSASATPSSESSESSVTPSADSSASAPASGSEPVKVNKSFADPQLGEKGTAISYVRNFPVSEALKQKFVALQDAEVVLVQLKLTSSTKFYDSFGESAFVLTGAGNGIDIAPSTSVVADAMKAAGYDPIVDAESGKTTTGWTAFIVRTELPDLTLRLKRSATSTSSGQQFPEKNFDVKLG